MPSASEKSSSVIGNVWLKAFSIKEKEVSGRKAESDEIEEADSHSIWLRMADALAKPKESFVSW